MTRPLEPRWLVVAAILIALLLPPLWVELRPAERAPIISTPTAPAADGHRVFVADWGYHTAIIIEQPPGWRLGPPGEEAAPFVEFAWGDRRFYMESNYWPHAVFATLILPTTPVTYVDGRASLPTRGFRSLHVREVSGAALRELAAELEASVARGANGFRSAPFAAVPGYGGRFYPGVGRYLWWMNCNRWVVDRLAAAGLADGGRGVIFSGEVARQLRGFTRVRDASASRAAPD